MRRTWTTVIVVSMSLGALGVGIPATLQDALVAQAHAGDPEVQYHPDYAQLLDELARADKDLDGADAGSPRLGFASATTRSWRA